MKGYIPVSIIRSNILTMYITHDSNDACGNNALRN